MQNVDPHRRPLTWEFVVDGPDAYLEPWGRLAKSVTRAVNSDRKRLLLQEWHSWWLGITWQFTEEDGRKVARTRVLDYATREIGTVALIWPSAEDLEGAA